MSLVPAKGLLWCVFAVALIGALAGPLPELGPLWILALLGVVLLALGDAIACFAGEQPTKASADSVARFTRGRPGRIAVTFARGDSRARSLRFALGLPPGFDSRDEELTVRLPEGAQRASIDWMCTPRARGAFRTAVACMETGSRFGMWRVRTRDVLRCELKVYPDLAPGRRRMAALMNTRDQSEFRVRRMVGRGRDFEKLRDYLPGDDFGEIHWKATAKRGRPVTKVFQVERTQEVYVVVDSSRLSGRIVESGSGQRTALESYLAAALVLMHSAERQGDRFGLIGHDDGVRLFLRAGRGPSHYAACREAALTLEPSDRTPDVAEIVRHLCTHLRKRALLFFLTDLSDPVLAEDFARHIRVLSRQHLVYVCQVPAPDIGPLFGGGEVANEDEICGRLAGHVRWTELRGLARRLKPLGVTAGLLSQETLSAELVRRYLEVKQRQAL